MCVSEKRRMSRNGNNARSSVENENAEGESKYITAVPPFSRTTGCRSPSRQGLFEPSTAVTGASPCEGLGDAMNEVLFLFPPLAVVEAVKIFGLGGEGFTRPGMSSR
jgi:hypothetical protein